MWKKQIKRKFKLACELGLIFLMPRICECGKIWQMEIGKNSHDVNSRCRCSIISCSHSLSQIKSTPLDGIHILISKINFLFLNSLKLSCTIISFEA